MGSNPIGPINFGLNMEELTDSILTAILKIQGMNPKDSDKDKIMKRLKEVDDKIWEVVEIIEDREITNFN